ncbi:hypothetical protein K470DRAFT_284851, partial [Piedraia hortae CBS 480.64]
RRPNIEREYDAGFERLYRDYFSDSPTFGHKASHRNLCMTRRIFLKITDALAAHNKPWTSFWPVGRNELDATVKLGIHPILKVTAATR